MLKHLVEKLKNREGFNKKINIDHFQRKDKDYLLCEITNLINQFN